MIVNMKEYRQDEINRKIVQTLGFVPFYMSMWGRKDDEVEDPPATLYTICPRCFKNLTIENKRDSIKYADHGNCFTIEGDKWGYQQDNGKSKKLLYTVNYISHGGHLVIIDHNDAGTACLFRIYEEVDAEE